MKNYLRVQSDGTGNGTKVFCPDGTEVMVKSIKLHIVARELEQATMVFYLTRKLCARFDGSPNGGLFFENGDRMDGLVRLTVDPLEQNGGDTATAVFHPKGSKGAPEPKLVWRKETDFASAPTDIHIAPCGAAPRPPASYTDAELVNTLLGLTMMAGNAFPGPTRDRAKALEIEVMRRLEWTRDIIRAREILRAGDNETLVDAADRVVRDSASEVYFETRRILNAGPNEGTTAAAARVVADWKACMEELDEDGCAKWANERRAIIEALDKLGAPTKGDPGGSTLSIIGRIRALADRSMQAALRNLFASDLHSHGNIVEAPTKFLGRPIDFWHEVQAVLRTLTTRPGDELEMLKQTVRQNMARGTMLAEMTRELKQAGKDRERYTERVLAMLKDTARAAGYDPDDATHGEEMVAGTIKAIKALRDCTEHAWALIANATAEWSKESDAWQDGAKAWRDNFNKLQSAYVALNPREREVPGATDEVSKDCGHGDVWVWHHMADISDETSRIEHGTCALCNRVVNRWAPTDEQQPPGQWRVGQGESLTLPRQGFGVIRHVKKAEA